MLLYTLTVALSVLFVAVPDTRPLRSDCIVGYELDWSSVKGSRTASRNALTVAKYSSRIGAVAALAISPDSKRLYLQFESNCDNKVAMATALIALWRSDGLALPGLKFIPGRIEPSIDTIEVGGPSWKDGPPPLDEPGMR